MKPSQKRNEFILSNGKEFYANQGIIGIAPTGKDDGATFLYEGYDGSLYDQYADFENEFSNDELIEIAEYMIEQWGNFKHNIESRGNAESRAL